MLATKAHAGLADSEPGEARVIDEDDRGDLAPAVGITLGAALGLVSIGALALVGWWLF